MNIRRAKPPINAKKYYGKPINDEIVKDYIGNHILILDDREMLVSEFFRITKDFSESFIKDFHSLFPLVIQDIVEKYLRENVLNEFGK